MSVLYLQTGKCSSTVKTEADSNDITECSHDDKPSISMFDLYSVYLVSCIISKKTRLSVLTAIFQVNLGYPVFVEAKDDGGGGDNWTTGAISRAKLQSNHHHQQTNIQVFFISGRMPFLSPCQSTEGKPKKTKSNSKYKIRQT